MPHARRTTPSAVPGISPRILVCGFVLFVLGVLGGCYERKQSAILNPDGSGKMTIETLVAVPTATGPAATKPSVVEFGRQVATGFINSTRGVEGWADVSVEETADGRARILATAYFPNINRLRFEMPLEFRWEKTSADTMELTVVRSRTPVASPAVTSDAALRDLTAKSQAQYKEQQLALHTQLNAFSLEMSFQMPGEFFTSPHFKKDGQTASIKLEGKKVSEALDKFMANEELLTATFRAGQDLPANDAAMLQTMYGSGGTARVVMHLVPDMKPAFDYKAELRDVQRAQGQMLEAAGIVLVQPFRVTGSATGPASQPATQPR